MNFCNRTLVEGFEDVAYLQAYFDLLDLSNNFRCLGCHIIPANGKSELLRPLAIIKQMKIPAYLIFDSDAAKEYRIEIKKKYENDNRAFFKLIGACNTAPFPLQTVWGKGYTVWSSDIGPVAEDEIGKRHWEKYQNQADQLYGHIGHLKKNSLHIGASLALPMLGKTADAPKVWKNCAKGFLNQTTAFLSTDYEWSKHARSLNGEQNLEELRF